VEGRIRTTIYIHDELDRRMRRIVPSRGLNRFINEAVEEKVTLIERQAIHEAMREGYLASGDEQREIDEDWDATTSEDWPE
jgi:hypothetical protein